MITLPLSYRPPESLAGARWPDLEHFYPGDRIRQIEKASIRMFMEQHRNLLKGRVLDFGSGKQPYRDLVEGEYVPYEKGECLPTGPFDAVMMNQVIQYIEDPRSCLDEMRCSLKPGGCLVITYPTNWAEVETEDLHRFTKAGMERLLNERGFAFITSRLRAEVIVGSFHFPLGYGCIARA